MKQLTSWQKQALIRLVVDHTGIKIRENDQEVFEQIIDARLRASGLSFPEEYYQLLEQNSDMGRAEWKNFIAEITNSESFFFRDKGQFSLLKNHIFPYLVQTRKREKRLRICSAGCSTGEEPYSIAMLLQDVIPDWQEWQITILGVDINSVALDRAKAGVYRPWSFRGVAPDAKQRFFTEQRELYHITEDVKAMVRFQTANLLTDDFHKLDLESTDLILCRNVFIYFSNAAIKQVLNKFYQALNPLGYLMVGHAELHSQNLTQFQIQVFEESIAYQRKSGRGGDPLAHGPQSRRASMAARIEKNIPDQQLTSNNAKLQKTALGLLKQLPADMRLPKLGNLTAAELISQIEQDLNTAE